MNSKTAAKNEIMLYESLGLNCLHFSVPKDHGLEIEIKEKLEKLREK